MEVPLYIHVHVHVIGLLSQSQSYFRWGKSEHYSTNGCIKMHTYLVCHAISRCTIISEVFL